MSSTTRMVKVKDTAHNCLMLEILPELYQAERHVDVTFHCKDGKQLKAHRLLLGSVSPFLQALFNDQVCKYLVTLYVINVLKKFMRLNYVEISLTICLLDWVCILWAKFPCNTTSSNRLLLILVLKVYLDGILMLVALQ